MLEVLKPDLKPTDINKNLFSDFGSFQITPRKDLDQPPFLQE